MGTKLETVVAPLISQDLIDKAQKAFPPVLVQPRETQAHKEQDLFNAGAHYAVQWFLKHSVRRVMSSEAGGRQ